MASELFLPIAADGFVLVDAEEKAACVDKHLLHSVTSGRPLSRVLPHPESTFWAVRATRDELDNIARLAGLRVNDGRIFGGDQVVARAIALLRNRDYLRHDPADGSTLGFDAEGVVAQSPSGRQIFPRIDPAVIGMVRLADDTLGTAEEKVLVGRNRRADYYSLIAGYVEAGETLEQAFAREVWEETARRIYQVEYRSSQPWPISGSLMMAFRALTQDTEAQAKTDDELVDCRFVTRAELSQLPMARPGSVAHTMLKEWMATS